MIIRQNLWNKVLKFTSKKQPAFSGVYHASNSCNSTCEGTCQSICNGDCVGMCADTCVMECDAGGTGMHNGGW